MDNNVKKQKYELLVKQIAATLSGETNDIAKMATISCMLKQEFPYYYWCGFYIVDANKPQELVIGPYQGTLGCLRIPFGKGVCGAAAATLETQIVEDVHQIQNHIACDSASNSEIVVPVYSDNKLIAVFDVDSTEYAAFNEIDKDYLEQILNSSF
ncbi:GAF domain-containing protein [Bacteriovorax sp. Seq25_V]|uniref:GAF domain-containing protein n=1 Tax=Bacteriovorax sp. Seq25_V TaxID=1201288 RepID=UPI000389F065|nr:GAF domain-containing protein [Bacteriovorax sp. Seq25_V]EQC44773.1 GAF domain protein [Bacteriovorax sp. Seq25_V]